MSKHYIENAPDSWGTWYDHRLCYCEDPFGTSWNLYPQLPDVVRGMTGKAQNAVGRNPSLRSAEFDMRPEGFLSNRGPKRAWDRRRKAYANS